MHVSAASSFARQPPSHYVSEVWLFNVVPFSPVYLLLLLCEIPVLEQLLSEAFLWTGVLNASKIALHKSFQNGMFLRRACCSFCSLPWTPIPTHARTCHWGHRGPVLSIFSATPITSVHDTVRKKEYPHVLLLVTGTVPFRSANYTLALSDCNF